jgi:UDP-N-acetylmuramoylalanine--D-glutamate ligase
MYLKRQSFLVFGLSKSGKAAAKYLLAQGAVVYVYDEIENDRILQTVTELETMGAKKISKDKLENAHVLCDALVLSPGIPIDHPIAVAFKRGGKGVISECELAARRMRNPLIAVTGTNGKTTTVSMLTEILKKGGLNAVACGNIGTPILEKIDGDLDDIMVAEISSFQLETLSSHCPHIAMILNVTEDHLNRHYTMENYIFLKKKLLKNSTESEYAVLNYDDATVRSFAEKTKARVVWFSLREKVNGAYVENGVLCFNGEKILSVSELPLGGAHNVLNALAAIAATKLMGVANEKIASALSLFKGIKHRIQEIGVVNGITFVDDSKGTNVDATMKAAACMQTETIILLGGKNKGYDYKKLFAGLKKTKVVHAVLYGENRYQLLTCARELAYGSVTVCETFAFAVQVATLRAKAGQTVLLSPASASFDEFASYEERGDAFVQIVQSFQKESEQSAEETEFKSERFHDTIDVDGDGIDGIDGVRADSGEGETE